MMSNANSKKLNFEINKKKRPPRPPPPNFTKYKSKSTYNLNQPPENFNLIDWSPPSSPKVDRNISFGGSVSSSFSSSTSSLASSKKSFEYDPVPFAKNIWPSAVSNKNSRPEQPRNSKTNSNETVPPIFGPTIIRAQPPKKIFRNQTETTKPGDFSLPMPTVPPPSPPKDVVDVVTPYGIALYEFTATQPEDLGLQVDDVVELIRKENNEWFYGRILDKEGIFPANFIDIIVPLPEDDNIATALYEFRPQMPGDLPLQPGQKIKVIKKISDSWLYGESNGKLGQFPSNFIDTIPKNL